MAAALFVLGCSDVASRMPGAGPGVSIEPMPPRNDGSAVLPGESTPSAAGSSAGGGAGGAASGPKASFWVSPDGDDAGDGSRARPFRSLERVRDAVRVARAMVPGQVTINLLSGTYRIVASLETGLLVRGNYVHGGGGTGIYTDYGARFATVRDNVVLPGHQGGCSVFPIEHLLSEGNFWTEEPEWYCGDAVDFVSRGNQVVDHAGCAGSAACAAIIQGAGLQPEFRDLLERW